MKFRTLFTNTLLLRRKYQNQSWERTDLRHEDTTGTVLLLSARGQLPVFTLYFYLKS